MRSLNRAKTAAFKDSLQESLNCFSQKRKSHLAHVKYIFRNIEKIPNSKFQIPNSKFQIPNSKTQRIPTIGEEGEQFMWQFWSFDIVL